MSDVISTPSVASISDSPAQMHENARKCTVSAECENPPPQLNTLTPQRALTPAHRVAIDMLAAGKRDHEICYQLKIDPSTLYRWKHHNPLFIAELNRRHQELWTDAAAELRLAVTKGIRTIEGQLIGADEVTKHRAARTLINLVNTDRISPRNVPTRVEDILDALLRRAQPPAAPESDPAEPTFTPAQRQALLDQLLTEEAQAEADCKAAAAQRSALYHQRRAQSSKSSSIQPPTPDNP